MTDYTNLPLSERITNSQADRARRETGEFVPPRVESRPGVPRDTSGMTNVFHGRSDTYAAFMQRDPDAVSKDEFLAAAQEARDYDDMAAAFRRNDMILATALHKRIHKRRALRPTTEADRVWKERSDDE